MSRLKTRVQRLEQQLTPAKARIWQVCLADEEAEDTAIARQGITPGPHDLVVIFRYGTCPTCVKECK